MEKSPHSTPWWRSTWFMVWLIAGLSIEVLIWFWSDGSFGAVLASVCFYPFLFPPVRPTSPDSLAGKDPSLFPWWKNTYFWIGGILLIVALIGLFGGEELIRDPGQRKDGGLLVWIYCLAGILMILNGWMSHQLFIQQLGEPNKKEK